jgi:hypothetical protein
MRSSLRRVETSGERERLKPGRTLAARAALPAGEGEPVGRFRGWRGGRYGADMPPFSFRRISGQLFRILVTGVRTCEKAHFPIVRSKVLHGTFREVFKLGEYTQLQLFESTGRFPVSPCNPSSSSSASDWAYIGLNNR